MGEGAGQDTEECAANPSRARAEVIQHQSMLPAALGSLESHGEGSD